MSSRLHVCEWWRGLPRQAAAAPAGFETRVLQSLAHLREAWTLADYTNDVPVATAIATLLNRCAHGAVAMAVVFRGLEYESVFRLAQQLYRAMSRHDCMPRWWYEHGLVEVYESDGVRVSREPGKGEWRPNARVVSRLELPRLIAWARQELGDSQLFASAPAPDFGPLQAVAP